MCQAAGSRAGRPAGSLARGQPARPSPCPSDCSALSSPSRRPLRLARCTCPGGGGRQRRVQGVEECCAARESRAVLRVLLRDARDQSLDPGGLGPPKLRFLAVDVVHDLRDDAERTVAQAEARDECLEGAGVPLVGVLGLEHVESELAPPRPVPLGGDELEPRLRVDEPANEPSARDAIDVDPLPGGAKQRFDLGVGQAIHEVGLAHRGLPATGHDLPHLPLEVFDRLVRAGQDVHRVLDGDCAETLQPAPHLHPEVVGFRRDLMDEEYPAVRGRLGHVGVASQTNLLTITSVSCENFPSKASRDRDYLTGGDMGQRIWALAALLLIIPARQQAQQPLAPIDWKLVDAGLGKDGALQPDGGYKVGLPRSDLHVTTAGVAVKPALALGSWVAFKQVSDTEAMVMGDLVLRERDVAEVLGKLQEAGIAQTALHNHLLNESPRVMYMHIAGRGTPARLAAALHAALALTATPFGAPAAATASGSFGIDTAQVAQILGYHGKVNGGVYQVGVPRAEQVTADGAEVPPSMGLATAINFQPTGPGRAAITGDFVLLGSEVKPVIRALRDNGIAITALHSHMLTDNPHLFFMHYWANDDALKLAHGLRAALDKMNVKKAG